MTKWSKVGPEIEALCLTTGLTFELYFDLEEWVCRCTGLRHAQMLGRGVTVEDAIYAALTRAAETIVKLGLKA